MWHVIYRGASDVISAAVSTPAWLRKTVRRAKEDCGQSRMIITLNDVSSLHVWARILKDQGALIVTVTVIISINVTNIVIT